MRRPVIAIVLAVLVVASVGSLAAATHHIPTDVPGDDGRVVAATADTDATGTPTPTVAPGARFAGAIGAHREHHAGEISEETVEVRLSQSGSELTRAAIPNPRTSRPRLRTVWPRRISAPDDDRSE